MVQSALHVRYFTGQAFTCHGQSGGEIEGRRGDWKVGFILHVVLCGCQGDILVARGKSLSDIRG